MGAVQIVDEGLPQARETGTAVSGGLDVQKLLFDYYSAVTIICDLLSPKWRIKRNETVNHRIAAQD